MPPKSETASGWIDRPHARDAAEIGLGAGEVRCTEAEVPQKSVGERVHPGMHGQRLAAFPRLPDDRRAAYAQRLEEHVQLA